MAFLCIKKEAPVLSRLKKFVLSCAGENVAGNCCRGVRGAVHGFRKREKRVGGFIRR